jgi:hypothetical protein
MNVSQALEVPISRVLEILNSRSAPRKGKQQFYFSVFRSEDNPSLHVNHETNEWYDFGIGTGGDVLHLVMHYLKSCGEDHTTADALRWMRNMTGSYQPTKISRPSVKDKPHPALVIRENTEFDHRGLLRYFSERGIMKLVACKYTRQLRVYNKETKNSFYAIGFKNEDRGWELRNPNFKACISPKGVSFIRGRSFKPAEINVFEGFFDFLSLASQSKDGKLEGDSLILNSLSCMERGLAYLKNYGYTSLKSFMDNDKAGAQAIERLSAFAKTQEGMTHRPMNGLYAEFKDVNAWHMNSQGLKPL